MDKILLIFLKLNFTPNTLDWDGLKKKLEKKEEKKLSQHAYVHKTRLTWKYEEVLLALMSKI